MPAYMITAVVDGEESVWMDAESDHRNFYDDLEEYYPLQSQPAGFWSTENKEEANKKAVELTEKTRMHHEVKDALW